MTILADALDLERQAIQYFERYGWSIIPMKTKDLPGVKWGPFQRHRLDRKGLAGKFPNHRITGLAVVPGRVSNGLMVRDYDTQEAYERWAATQPELASTLPTAATARGFHVYFRGKPFDFRAATGKDDPTCVSYMDGELRAGRGYVVLPPSLHPSGIRYRWVRPPEEQIPLVTSLVDSGFLGVPKPKKPKACSSRSQNYTEVVCLGACVGEDLRDWNSSALELSEDWRSTWESLQLVETLPTRPGQRRSALFDLARRVRSLPHCLDAGVGDFEPLVREWHRIALPVIRTRPFRTTWADFKSAFNDVKFPWSSCAIQPLYERACQRELPAEFDRYTKPRQRKLIALCRELQESAGADPFFLGCRTGAKLLGACQGSVCTWLTMLVDDGVLDLVRRGCRRPKIASRFRYIGLA